MEQAARDGGVAVLCETHGYAFDLRITLYSNERDRIVSVAEYQEPDDIEGIFGRLFPWSTVELDEMAYYDEDIQTHDELCALREADGDEPWGYTESFEDWRNDLASFRAACREQ